MNCSKAKGCRHYLTGVGCMVCENQNNFKPLRETNYDRIISKSPEDLAMWIVDEGWKFGTECEGYMSLLDWLEQEVVTD